MSTAKLMPISANRSATASSCDSEDEAPPDLSLAPALLIVVENPREWQTVFPHEQVLSATEYLDTRSAHAERSPMVVNLCKSYKYLSPGYYCSLLAEARGQRAFPSVKTINDLSRKAIYRLDTVDLDVSLNQIAGNHNQAQFPATFSIDIVCGLTDYAPLASVAMEIFKSFPAPLLRVEFARSGGWHIRSIKLQQHGALSPVQHSLFARGIKNLHLPDTLSGAQQHPYRYRLAILQNPLEALAPSNSAALEKFVSIGQEFGIQVDLIEKKDYPDLPHYDALFIRETTAINHHTYLFAKKAENDGLVVIDDANSILRCTNKVYLADLLRMHAIPAPQTLIIRAHDLKNLPAIEAQMAYPIVLKIPDGAFSRGVFKVSHRAALLEKSQELLRHSSLILAQEYVYTEFDWRIGILNRQAIFASQYFMSKDHWQVAKSDANGKAEFGMARSVALTEVPPALLDYALQAANLIGDSLYGVDMKMTARGPMVIEVNDNPNLDVGIEDSVLGDDLYHIVLREIIRRIEVKRGGVA